MKENPLVSVIIPVYNPGNHLIKCLDSVVNQSYRNLEIILIDDGSSDGSDKVCDEYAQKDPRIICVHQPNGGVSKARNKGLELMTGDYVHFPDSDDYYDLDTYEILLQQLKSDNTDAVCFEYYTTYQDHEIIHKMDENQYGVFKTEDSIRALLFSGRSFLCTKLLPNYSVKNIRFFENIYRDEDTIFCMMAFHLIPTISFIDEPLLHYVQSEQSATRGSFKKNQLSAVKAIPIVEEFLSVNYPMLLDQWYVNYMQLMIMLYGDMYLDGNDYQKEKHDIYCVFMELYGKTDIAGIKNQKTRVKFDIFKRSPKAFCLIHKMIHRL